MRNARRYDFRITIGVVPTSEDLDQLRALGYKTLVDLRDGAERFGGSVGRGAEEAGLNYVNIPVDRSEITLEKLGRFYNVVYAKGTAPLYLFSRFGRRPLAFLLLFDAVRTERPLLEVFRGASHFGLSLEEDEALHEFLVTYYRNLEFEKLVRSVCEARPELFR